MLVYSCPSIIVGYNNNIQPLHLAAHCGQAESARQLIEAGANIAAYEEKEYLSVLGQACVGGHTDIIKMIISAGVCLSPLGSICGFFRRIYPCDHSKDEYCKIALLYIAGAGYDSLKTQCTDIENCLPKDRNSVLLTAITRNFIREHMKTCIPGHNLLKPIKTLPVPELIQEYILFNCDFNVTECNDSPW